MLLVLPATKGNLLFPSGYTPSVLSFRLHCGPSFTPQLYRVETNFLVQGVIRHPGEGVVGRDAAGDAWGCKKQPRPGAGEGRVCGRGSGTAGSRETRGHGHCALSCCSSAGRPPLSLLLRSGHTAVGEATSRCCTCLCLHTVLLRTNE